MIVETVELMLLDAGCASGVIHIVHLPVQCPAPRASISCCLPGVAAAMQACMSPWLMPGGSCISPAELPWPLWSLGDWWLSEPTSSLVVAQPTNAVRAR